MAGAGAGGGWRWLASPGGRRGALPDKVLQRLVEQIIVVSSGPGQVQQRASWSRTMWRESGVPFSDMTVFRTASLGTWTSILRARFCDTLPTCRATVYGDFWKNFLRIST